ncbi:TonB-dependent receptor [Lacimicrobium alkaliphilum]|uniref:TonB-dependent receptor n=1 Tax=Lacimicrobium alkaliphilum TaxID=1526571 RepID=A0ABQ1RG58_9ALTE|nr:TonB-dependent receptor [Lacimicrobium alkaliphilum]GGD69420.1 TonB-dependent receptor [Lacimicrobium alkaliphilum]
MKTRNSIHKVAFAVTSALTITGTSVAQQDVNQRNEATIEQIVVKGYRSSLRESAALKQDADNVTETILAEDIASFPDLNLAESLQRISGVTISRDSGEGRQIALRGLGPNFTRTRVNGLEALFTTDSGVDQRGSASRTRDFDFSVFASELFNRIDVHKSYDASLDEGGLAGTVDLHTARPFDYDGFRGALSAKAIYNDMNDSTGPRLAALLSNTWGDVGALVSVAYSQVETIEKGYHVWSWRRASFGENNVADSVDAAVADRLVNATGANRVFVPRANNIASWHNDRERLGITASLQWQPSTTVNWSLDGLFGQLSNDRIENQISTAGTNAFTGDVTAGQLLVDAAIVGDNLMYASFENLDLRTESKVSYGETNFYQLSLSGEFFITDALSANLLLGRSESDFDQPVHDKVFAEASGHTFSVDWRDAAYGQNSYGFDIADAAEWSLMRTDVREDSIDNQYNTVQTDWSYEFDNGDSLDFGAQLKSYESNGFERRDREDWENDAEAPEAVFQLTQIPILRPYIIADNFATFERVEATGRISRQLDASFNRPGTVYDLKEETTAAYAKYNFYKDIGGMALRGNLGVRWYQTEQTSSGEVNTGTGLEYVTFEKNYDDFLPSVNLALDLNDQWVLRVGANRNISRPALNQLRAAAQVGVADTRIGAGNPNLERFVADSFDGALEYYSEDLRFALGLFYKDMDSFIVEQSVTKPYAQTGYPLEFLEFDPRVNAQTEFTVQQPINGDGATVQGLELALQADLTFLPGLLSNLGVATNVTLADGETTLFNEGQAFEVTPPGLSELAYNITVYYETDSWGLRLSQAYRDDYVAGEGESQNVVQGYDDTRFIDFKAFYNVSEQLQVTFEGNNLTDERIRQFQDNRTQSYTTSGRNLILGMVYTF